MKTLKLALKHLAGGLPWLAIMVIMAAPSIAQAAPTIYGVYSYDGLTVGVQYNGPVDPTTATTPGNYTVTGATVTGATLNPDGSSVALTLDSQINGQFVVTVNNVEDTSLNPIAPNTTATNTVLNLTILPFGDAGAMPYSATYTGNYATLIASGSDLYQNGDNFVFEYLPVTNDFDYCMKVVNIGNDGQAFNRSGLMVRDDLFDNYSHMILVARNGGPNAGNTAPDSVQVSLRFIMDTSTATYSEPPNPLPAFYGSNSWVRLQRQGNTFTAYYGSNGVDWVKLYQFNASTTNTPDNIPQDGLFTNSVLYLGMATCAHDNTVDTTNIVSDLGATPNEPVKILTQPPASVYWPQNTAQSISVVASGVPVYYQWMKNSINIPGATNATYSVVSVNSSDAGTYSVQVYNNFSSIVSSNCVVTYLADTNPPTIYGVYSYRGGSVGVQFDKPVDPASATAIGNYTVSGATVTSATLNPDGASVALALASPIVGQFVVTVNNVRDAVGNTIAANSKATNTVLNLTTLAFGDANSQPYSATYNGNFAALIAGGSDLYGAGDNFVFEYMPVTNNFDYCMRIFSIMNDGQAFNRSGLMVRDSLTNIYSHMILVARNGGPNAGNTAPDSAQVTLRLIYNDTNDLTLSEPPNPLPAFYGSNSWVRLQRLGNVYTSYYSSNGVDWVQLYQFDGSVAGDGMFTNSVQYLGMATCAHNASLTTSNLVCDLGATVLPALPLIIAQPTSDVLYSGRTAKFSVTAGGAGPFAYEWLSNGTNIIGATNSTLSASNGIPGSYQVIVYNANGSVTSSVASLTFVTPTTVYEKAVMTDNPVAYWRLGETNNPATGIAPAYDYAGSINGIYGKGTQNRFNGILGPEPSSGFYGFEVTNGALATYNATSNSYVTAGGLSLNTNTVTITAWINPVGPQNGAAAILFCRDGTTTAGLNYNGSTLGFTWANGQWWWGSGLTPPTNQWSFVALTIAPTSTNSAMLNATLYVYNNATNLQSAVDSAFTAGNQGFSGPTLIGTDPYDYVNRAFNGRIDEVAVFSYALTQAQVQQLYFAGLNPLLTIGPSGGNVVLNWTAGTLLESTNLSGPWTTDSATPPYTNAPTAPQKFYRLQLQ